MKSLLYKRLMLIAAAFVAAVECVAAVT